MACEGNEEELEYWLARCVERIHKLTYPQCDDDGFEYPIGFMVLVGTWIRKIVSTRNGLEAYEDYEPNKKIIHYLHLILEINIKLSRYKGMPTNRVFWKYSIQEHETIMNALYEREDADGIDD